MSDSHDAWHNLETAVRIATERGCEHILHAGDFISPTGLEVLKDFPGKIHIVWGNNEGEKVGFIKMLAALPRITHRGDVMEETIGGLRFYMNHYPGIAENAALTGKYDVVVFGHTHEYHDETKPNGTLLVNPGDVQGLRTGVASMIVFDTVTKIAERITL